MSWRGLLGVVVLTVGCVTGPTSRPSAVPLVARLAVLESILADTRAAEREVQAGRAELRRWRRAMERDPGPATRAKLREVIERRASAALAQIDRLVRRTVRLRRAVEPLGEPPRAGEDLLGRSLRYYLRVSSPQELRYLRRELTRALRRARSDGERPSVWLRYAQRHAQGVLADLREQLGAYLGLERARSERPAPLRLDDQRFDRWVRFDRWLEADVHGRTPRELGIRLHELQPLE